MLPAMTDPSPSPEPQDGGWRRTLGRAWHWLVLAICAIGAAVCARFVWTSWSTFQAETETGGSGVLWLGIGAVLVLLALGFLWEAINRIRRLRQG
jgi:putative flippase GtrA